MLDGAVLARSLEVIVGRHEILRTSFPDGDEQPVQLVSQAAAPTLRVIDRRHLPSKGRSAAIAQAVRQEAGHGFDLTAGPLLRLSLYQFAKNDHVLVLVAHQSIFDGRSLDIFYRELEMLYAAGGAVERANLPTLTVQYADYACRQRDRQSNAALAAQLAYWKKRLDRASAVLELPADRPRAVQPSSKGARRKIVIDETLTGALKELSRKSATTLFVTLMAAFKVLLHRYTAEEDIIVGFPVASRDQPELENLIGCFVNTLLLRSDLSGAPSFRALLAQLRAATNGALSHRDLDRKSVV